MSGPPNSSTEAAFDRLRRSNLIAFGLHAVQAVVVLLLANSFSLPVTAVYLEGPPGGLPTGRVTVFTTPVGLIVALFLALSAVAHLIVATVWQRGYRTDLLNTMNRARWIEYSISSSIMMVLIAQLVGIADIAALVAIFGVNGSMILFGWLQETYEAPGNKGWLPFIFGCIAGIVPWICVVLYTVAPKAGSDANPPGFVYAIIISLFVFFNIFAVNQLLQYRQRGRWANYLYGEQVYIVLSLVAKSALAWQLFGGTLAG